MAARFRNPQRPILGQQIADIYNRLEALEGRVLRAGGGLGAGGGGGGGGIGGSGAPNMIPKWVTSASLGNSYFTDDGVNTTDLDYPDNNATNLRLSAYGIWQGSPTIPAVTTRYTRGTHLAPGSAIVGGDFLGKLAFRGADSTGFSTHDDADIRAVATPSGPAWTTTDHGVSLGFWLTALGSVTPHLRFAISSQGRIGLYSGDSDYYANFFGSPAGMTASRLYTLPANYPAASGYVLSCTVDGYMSWVAQAGGGGIGGSGTAGNLAKFTASTTIGNSGLTVDAYGDLAVPGDISTEIAIYYRTLASGPQKSGYVSLYAKLDNRLYYKPYGEAEIGPLDGGGGIGGSGTVGNLAKFTASTTIGNSGLTVDAYGDLMVPGDITTNIAVYYKPLASGPQMSGYIGLYAKLDNKLYYKSYGGAEIGPLGGGIGGSGTADYLPVFTGPTTLGNSIIRHLGAGAVLVNGDLYPEPTNTRRLGRNENNWTETWIGSLWNTSYGRIDWHCHATVYAHNTYDLGASSKKWRCIYAVSTSFGDLGFSDKTCPKCDQRFRKGQKLALVIKHARKNGIEAVPCHIECRIRSG